MECPTCGDEFDTARAMKAHHQWHDRPYWDVKIEEETGESVSEFLERKYHDEKLTLEEIGEVFGASNSTIQDIMRRHDIPTRNNSEAKELMWEETDNPDRFLSEAHETTREMVENGEHNFQDPDFERVQPDELHERKPYANHKLSQRGYSVWQSHDPDGVHRGMKVHRLLAIAEHGIGAVKDKVVHHENGIKWDNRPENIEVMDETEHLRQHYEEREIDENGRFV
jgi:hypothetical protein